MKKPKQRNKGDVFRPMVTVMKAGKNGVPTRIEFNGQTYTLAHEHSFNERKRGVAK